MTQYVATEWGDDIAEAKRAEAKRRGIYLGHIEKADDYRQGHHSRDLEVERMRLALQLLVNAASPGGTASLAYMTVPRRLIEQAQAALKGEK